MIESMAKGQGAGDMMPLVMMSMMTNQQNSSKRHRRNRRSGGSSSDDSSDSASGSKDVGMKAVTSLHRLQKRIRRHSRRSELVSGGVAEEATVGKVSWPHHGCSGLRVGSCRRLPRRRRSARTEYEEPVTVRAERRRVAECMVADGHRRSNFEKRVCWQQIRDGGDSQLCEEPPQASEEGEGSRYCEGRGPGLIPLQTPTPQRTRGRYPGERGTISKFTRFFSWLQNTQGALPERSGDNLPLFPSMLPYPEALAKGLSKFLVWMGQLCCSGMP